MRIISTLGPASATAAFVAGATQLGQPQFRFNGSHLDSNALERLATLVSQNASDATRYLDLQGDKRRIGALPKPMALAKDERVTLRLAPVSSDGTLPVPDAELFAHAQAGDQLVLQDAEAVLRIVDADADGLVAQVEQATVLRAHCGIHITGKALSGTALPPAQHKQLALAARLGIEAVALSFVCTADDLRRLRQACAALDYQPRLVAKLERPEAFERLPAIAQACDELWLCRGDLGSLAGLEALGQLQQQAFAAAKHSATPLIVAGQVLHHLTEHANPTRSEVVHAYDIGQADAAGIVLSDETAIGHDPANALRWATRLFAAPVMA